MIQANPTPDAAPAAEDTFSPPVWTPSRKCGLSTSSDLFTLHDFVGPTQDPLTAGTPRPTLKKARWGDEPPAILSPSPAQGESHTPPALDLFSKVNAALLALVGSPDLPSGSLAVHLEVDVLAQLYFLFGIDAQTVEVSIAPAIEKGPSLPFAGTACPHCLPESIFHATGTKCPLSKLV